MARFISSHAYTFDDVLLKPQYSTIDSRSEIKTKVEIAPGIFLETPLMSANMQSVNSVELAVTLSQLGSMATLDQFQDISLQVEMLKEIKKKDARVAGAIGVTKDYLERAEALIKSKVDLIIMDTPHGHNALTIKAVKEFRSKFKDFPLIAGNIATHEAARDLIAAGVDGLKVGVGPGAACTTRIKTGSGMPQVTAIMECFDVAREKGVSILADGGIKSSGSFAKAIAAGGTAVYAGSIFAGTKESPGEIVEIDGKKYKQYFGSSSELAKKLRQEKDKNYKEPTKRHVEGAEGYTKYSGTLAELIDDYMMGLRSAMSYSGCRTIDEFHEKAIFMILTQNGVTENGAHGLV